MPLLFIAPGRGMGNAPSSTLYGKGQLDGLTGMKR